MNLRTEPPQLDALVVDEGDIFCVFVRGIPTPADPSGLIDGRKHTFMVVNKELRPIDIQKLFGWPRVKHRVLKGDWNENAMAAASKRAGQA